MAHRYVPPGEVAQLLHEILATLKSIDERLAPHLVTSPDSLTPEQAQEIQERFVAESVDGTPLRQEWLDVDLIECLCGKCQRGGQCRSMQRLRGET